jgi:putative ABC transport system permease protein
MHWTVDLSPDAAAVLRTLAAEERTPVAAALDRLAESGPGQSPEGERWVQVEAGAYVLVCVPRAGRTVLVASIEPLMASHALADTALAPTRRLVRTLRGDEPPRGPLKSRSFTDRSTPSIRASVMNLLFELRLAARTLRRDRAITLLAAAALAIGIGVPAAMFGMVDAAVLRGLPIEGAKQVMHLERKPDGAGAGEGWNVPPRDVVEWQAQQRSFESLEAFRFQEVTLRSGQTTDRYSASVLTPGTFGVLRVQAAEGRVLQEADALPGAAPVVVLGHNVRRDRFSGEAAVGRTVLIDGVAHEVVGVMPEGFAFPTAEQLWLPLSLAAVTGDDAARATLSGIGRLRPGVSADEARAEFGVIAARLVERYPETNRNLGVVIKPFTTRFIGETATTTMFFVLGAVLLVLVVACANVANLLLVRAVRRARDLAVHSALGATRSRIARQLLLESLLLAVVGGAAGVAVAAAGLGGLRRAFGERMPYWAEPRLDGSVLLFMAGLVVLSTLLAGLLPALRTGRGDLSATLRDESRGSTGQRTNRIMAGLVVLEIALSLALLVGTGLMGRSVQAVQPERLGMPHADIMTARVSLPRDRDADARRAYYRAFEDALARAPSAAAVGLGSVLPMTHSPFTRFALDGEVHERYDDQPPIRQAAVSSGWFAAYGVQATRGRLFDVTDGPDAPPSVIVNESFVQRYFTDRDPVGERIRLGADPDAWRTVVGVVPDLWAGALDSSPDRNPPAVYLPFAQAPPLSAAIAVRVRTPPLEFVPALRAAAFEAEPDVPLHEIATMTSVIENNSWFYGMAASIFGICGLSTLILATVGTYGVIAYSVGRRTREFGIRMAMGARRGDILRLVVGNGAAQVALGLAIGLALALVIARGVSTLLFGVSMTDPLVLVGTTAVLCAVAVAAMIIPARRAAGTDPLDALRAE